MGKTIKDREYSFRHTQQRLKERYNIFINEEDYTKLCAQIKRNHNADIVVIEKQKDDIQTIYDVQYKYIAKIRVVWSKNRGCITTAIPRR